MAESPRSGRRISVVLGVFQKQLGQLLSQTFGAPGGVTLQGGQISQEMAVGTRT